jgi:hypothetical protein
VVIDFWCRGTREKTLGFGYIKIDVLQVFLEVIRRLEVCSRLGVRMFHSGVHITGKFKIINN